MRVHVSVDGGFGGSVQEALLTTGWPFTGDAPSFEVATTSERLDGEITFVVTGDEQGLDAFPGAARIFLFTGDEKALARELRDALRLLQRARDASPYRQLLDECPVPIVVKDARGDVLYANGAGREATGRTIVRTNLGNAAQETGVTEALEEWQLTGAAADDADFFVPRQRGYRKTTRSHARLRNGTDVVMDVSADVSMDRAVRDELSQELGLMRSLLDSLPSLVLVTDEQDCVVMLNPTLSRALGAEREQLVGMEMGALWPAEALVRWRAASAEARATNREITYESERVLADGSRVTYSGTTRATLGPSGQTWILTVAVDVSELRRAKQDAESATLAAMEASRVKSQFLANMSHEIRTPMNGVLGMLQLALGTELTADQREYLDAAHMSAESLLTIINDILDISKIEAGKITLEQIPFAIADMKQGLTTLIARAKEKGLATSIEIANDVPERVVGDPVRFRQIVVNLLGNAIKFTETGSVDVRVFVDDPRTSQLHVTVTDTGIGLSSDQAAHIFDPFSQADGTTTRRFGGTGLGLSICRELVHMMGGKVWVESELGRGSTFHFTARLPESHAPVSVARPVPAADTSAKANDAPARRLEVLIAEDNPVGAKVAVRTLELCGCLPFHVGNGQQAVDAATTRVFDLVLMDMQMPVMDGLEATRKIRAWEEANGKARMPIVALTANAMKGDAEMCVAAGMDGHLAKPIAQDLLRAAIADVQRRAARPVTQAPKAPSLPPVDLEKALELCGDDAELLVEVAAAFDTSAQENCASLDAALSENDAPAVHKAAHALKGVLVYVCAGRAAAIAQQICTKAKAGELGSVAALATDLREECARVSEALAAYTQKVRAPAA